MEKKKLSSYATCPVCKTTFFMRCPREYAYKDQTKCYCSWTCLRTAKKAKAKTKHELVIERELKGKRYE